MSETLSADSLKGTARYTWGGDEFLFVEISEAMSLAANFKSNSMATRLGARALPGVTEICPANASLLVRFDPDVLGAAELEAATREIEVEVDNTTHPVLNTRLIEVPVWAWHWARPDDARIPWARAHKYLLDPQVLAQKRQAIAAHVSQVSPPAVLSRETLERLMQPFELVFL